MERKPGPSGSGCAARKSRPCITGTKAFPLNDLFVFQFAVSVGINISFSACKLQPVVNNCSLKSSPTVNKASAPRLKGGLLINKGSFSSAAQVRNEEILGGNSGVITELHAEKKSSNRKHNLKRWRLSKVSAFTFYWLKGHSTHVAGTLYFEKLSF